MPVDIFTKDQFEAALPNAWDPRRPRASAFEGGQWAYQMHVANGMAIKVYSGVGAGGVSAGCGEDSIRAVIIRVADGRVYGSKLKRWVTRQSGWRARLTDMLREMWKLALLTGPCTEMLPAGRPTQTYDGSERCKGTVGVYVVRKASSKNKGRMFRRCDGCELLEWLVKDEKGALRREAA